METKCKTLAYLFVAVTSVLCAGCGSSGKGDHGDREVPVRTYTVSPREGVYTRSYVGEIEGETSSSLSFQLPGYVERVYVREGQRVAQGELLARLDKTTLQSTYDAALSTLRQAEDAYARMEQLHDNGSLPEVCRAIKSAGAAVQHIKYNANRNVADNGQRGEYHVAVVVLLISIHRH